MPYRARFDDLRAGSALVFGEPSDVIAASEPSEVLPALRAVASACRSGRWAFGFVAHEAVAGLDASVGPQPPPSVPLVWFGLTDAPVRTTEPPAGGDYWTAPWRLAWDRARHAAAVTAVRAAITAGSVYQVNVTARLHGRLVGDDRGLYADLVRAQRGEHNAYVDFGTGAVLSASPELFLDWAPPLLRTRPMKGTAARGTDPVSDERARLALPACAKDVAENVMIVDLLRNDLGRVARTGTVRVPALLTTEAYPTVWQLTSDIECETRDDVDLVDVLSALFPSGSVTGAPKHSALQWIRAVEDEPRGVYCGAVGWVGPDRARFNVAIRTVVVDRTTAGAVYGAGGGITIDSTAGSEWDELITKTAVLPVSEPLQLLETFALTGGSCRDLDRHLRRLAASAGVFGFDCDVPAVRAAVQAAVEGAADARVGLRLNPDGSTEIRLAPLPALSDPVRLAVDSPITQEDSPFVRHKTSHRAHYDAARARHAGVDDVVLVNTRGELSETTIANLAVRFGDTWSTPPLSSGCLPGIAREIAIEQGRLVERTLRPADLGRADEVAVLNSLRGWRTAVLLPAMTQCSHELRRRRGARTVPVPGRGRGALRRAGRVADARACGARGARRPRLAHRQPGLGHARRAERRGSRPRGAGRDGGPARCRPAGHRLRPQHDPADVRPGPHSGGGVVGRGRGRRQPVGPRRERPPVGDRCRTRRGHGAIRGFRRPDRRALGGRRRTRGRRAHPPGRAHRRVEPDRHAS